MAYQLQNLAAIVRRGCSRFEIPVQVRLLEGRQPAVNDSEARGFTIFPPCSRRHKPMMTRIAKLLDSVRPLFGFDLIVFHRAVDEQEPTAALQHARGLAHK